MIAVLARLHVDNWDRFTAAHDEAAHLQMRRDRGNLWHRVLNGLDDPDDVVFLDAWSTPQDSDSYYHSDDFQRDQEAMGATLVEIIKLEDTDCSTIDDGPGPFSS
jgi:quinol monooxygenase YgiN